MSTIDADIHRSRRSALAPFFSSASTALYKPCISAKIECISAHLENSKRTGEVVELRRLFWCMATDIITELAFPEGIGLLSGQEPNMDYYMFQKKGQGKLLWFKHFPFLWVILKRMPSRWLLRMEPKAEIALNWESRNKTLAREIIAGSPHSTYRDILEGSIIFHHLLRSDLPPSEKAFDRIWQDATSLMGAGVETISNTLCVTIFHLLENQAALAQLVSELQAAIPDPTYIPPTHSLAALPYLSAVVQEGLRKAMGVMSRFIRVAPSDAIAYGSYVLPPGTAVSISTLLVHNDAATFRNPEKFTPERWLPSAAGGACGESPLADMKQQMIAFGGGTRKCIGVHLAHAELYLTLAVLFRRFRFELFETTAVDVDAMHDSLLPLPWEGSKGVRVRVR
jgi:cytochrome P450